MEAAIQFAVGISCLVIGVSALLHHSDWLTWLDQMRQRGRTESLAMGMVGLGVSALIFGFHQIWSGIPLIVTLIGLIGIIEGTIYLLFPQLLPKVISCFLPHPRFFRIWAIVVTVLGAIILYGWWVTPVVAV